MPSLPISKSKIDKLGDRLRDTEAYPDEDLVLLEQVLAAYDDALQCIRSDLLELGFEPTVRLKTTGTLVDKLRRSRSSSLKTIQDLAGARLVTDGGLREQDEATRRVVEMCEAKGYPSEIVDRRSDPRQGYRAVHVVCRVDGIPVEIQIRSELQDLWAQMFERLADVWGRGIRYGEQPDATGIDQKIYAARVEIVQIMQEFSSAVATIEQDKATYNEWPPRFPPTPVSEPVDDRERRMRSLTMASRQVVASIHLLEQTVRRTMEELGRLIDQEVAKR